MLIWNNNLIVNMTNKQLSWWCHFHDYYPLVWDDPIFLHCLPLHIYHMCVILYFGVTAKLFGTVYIETTLVSLRPLVRRWWCWIEKMVNSLIICLVHAYYLLRIIYRRCLCILYSWIPL